MSANGDALPGGDALYEAAACGLVLTDSTGIIHCANQTFCSWLGYDPQTLSGKVRLQDLLTVGGKIFHQTHWLPLLSMQGSIAEVKLDLVHRDGRIIPVMINAVSREHGQVRYHELAIFVAEDRHRYERELMIARKRAEELLATQIENQNALALADARLRAAAEDRARFAEQMIGIVSHDLRTPLTAIKLGVDLLGVDAMEAPRRERIARHVDMSVDRARRLVDDLLDFTQGKLGSGLNIFPEPVNLHQVIGDAVGELRLAFPSRCIAHVQHGSGEAILDADRLTQLLSNLVSNAMAYGAVNSQVTITSRTEGRAFEIEVHNAGVPIPDDVLPTIFEPMTRGAVTGSELRSVGLGLFIVREIVRAHRGQIVATSSLEQGTVFRASFPGA